MTQPLKSVLGESLRQLRHARGLSQEALAAELDVTPSYMAGIERGERNLTLGSVGAQAAQLGVESASLLVKS